MPKCLTTEQLNNAAMGEPMNIGDTILMAEELLRARKKLAELNVSTALPKPSQALVDEVLRNARPYR